MNMRIQDGTPIFDGDKVMIGGNDSYIPVCREHYKKMRKLHS
jgi:thymidine kinase